MPFVSLENYPPPWMFGTSTLLGDGSTLLPGNWWRIIRSNNIATNSGGQLQFRLEEVFEEQRLKHASEAPSRQNCLFVCPTEAAAKRFAESQSRRQDVWYRIEPIENLTQVFVARWNLVDRNDVHDSVRVRQRAKRYWTEADPEGPIELLLPCAARILGRVPELGWN